MEVALVFPHQLFASHPALHLRRETWLIEDSLFFGNDEHWPLRFHAQKLVLHRASMSAWMKARQAEGYQVRRVECGHAATTTERLLSAALPDGVTTLHVCDPVDDVLSRRLRRFADDRGAKLIVHATPMFLSPPELLQSQIGNRKKPFMATFYQAQRKRMGVLMAADGQPVGGQWSFDTENRQKLPKGHRAPSLPQFASTPELEEAKHYVSKCFPEARGSMEHFRWPVTQDQARQELHDFLEHRLALFGHYEDAISQNQPWLYHSVLSAPLNIGLITPQEIVEATLDHVSRHEVPLNSLEGFLRQIIGWREFMRGIYQFHGVKVRQGNFFQHHEALPESFHQATTGIPPVDAVIRRLQRDAWCHHIERLMVMGNLMALMRIHPDAVYRWFMEWFIDAYDWVMVPNVHGMSQHADGGLFTTKPYISGSNYILKMSDHPKGLWCAPWDELYWRFIGDHRDFFLRHPRMSMMVRQWDKRQAAQQAGGR